MKENYMNFNGRASRSEYWNYFLGYILLSLAIGVLTQVLSLILGMETIAQIISIVVSLGFLLPSLSAAVRRLHDINKSGWMILVALIPIAGIIYLIYLLAQPSQEGENEYGAAAPQPF